LGDNLEKEVKFNSVGQPEKSPVQVNKVKEEEIIKPKSYNGVDLTTNPNATKVYKKPVVLKFEYAKEEGVIETKEGSVRYKAGDAILTGTKGERWPIQKEKFEDTYDIVGDGQCAKKKIQVWALQVNETFTVNVSWSKDPLTGKPGDWLVQYGKNDYGIVSKDIFEETYERIE